MMQPKFLTGSFPAPARRGQSLVEFALTATLLMFLLLATIDFGMAFFSWITLRDAAQEGATYGAILPPLSSAESDASVINIKARVRDAATTPVNLVGLANDHITITLLNSDGSTSPTPKACPGNGVRVKVVYDYRFITPMISGFVGSTTIPITATVTDTILQAGNGVTCP